MARLMIDLATLLVLCATLAWTASINQAPLPQKAESVRPIRPEWADEHHQANCSGRAVARIEELRAGDWLQQTLINRGFVVYGAAILDALPLRRI